ncbi:hypothetical protein M413DRAFT_289738 [Hebeloma cylindrosporum]|uniref:Uncharacterized protein n=1 Tax=Hebeloma cylindrosporum TaxID=76867 RepID=A0A0C3BWG3_HEBCY|nr:hypothetical protein M413DRAFT_289738 [Hebeloma cylindrosporum h7]
MSADRKSPFWATLPFDGLRGAGFHRGLRAPYLMACTNITRPRLVIYRISRTNAFIERFIPRMNSS